MRHQQEEQQYVAVATAAGAGATTTTAATETTETRTIRQKVKYYGTELQRFFAHLSLDVVDLELVGLPLDGCGHLAPVLGEVLDALEAGDELEGDEALLVALDVLEQELVLGDVCVGEVKLHLLHDLLAEVVVRLLVGHVGLLLDVVQGRLLKDGGGAHVGGGGRLAAGQSGGGGEVGDARVGRVLPVAESGLGAVARGWGHDGGGVVRVVVWVRVGRAGDVVVAGRSAGLRAVKVNGAVCARRGGARRVHGVEVLVGERHRVGVDGGELGVERHLEGWIGTGAANFPANNKKNDN